MTRMTTRSQSDALTGSVLTFVGLPGLVPLPAWQMLAIFAYALVACFGVNDAIKVALIEWRVLKPIVKAPLDPTPRIAARAYELYEQHGRQDGRDVQDWTRAEQEIRKAAPQR